MIEAEKNANLATARAQTLRAAQWLRLLCFQVDPGKPMFGPGITTYADMFDPEASDERRLAACRRMHKALHWKVGAERASAEGIRAQTRPLDPYGLEWRTTQRGAILETISETLEGAIGGFEAAKSENYR